MSKSSPESRSAERSALESLSAAGLAEREIQDAEGRRVDADAAEHAARVAAEATVFMRDRVLSIVSHDLRGPLNAIHSWAHVLERKIVSEDPGIARAIAGIRTGVEQQVKLIEDVIDKTRSASKNLTLTLDRVDPAAVVEAEIDNIGATLGRQHGVTIEHRIDLAGVDATLDAVRFGQAVWTMIAYAIETGAAGAAVEVAAHADSGRIEVAVSFTDGPLADPNAPLAPQAGMFGLIPASLDNGALPLALPTRVAAAHGGDLSNEILADGRRRIAIRQPVQARY